MYSLICALQNQPDRDSKDMEATRRWNKLSAVLWLALALLVSACDKTSDTSGSSQPDPDARGVTYQGGLSVNYLYKLADLPDAEQLFTLQSGDYSGDSAYQGTSDSPNIILYSQGGPARELEGFHYHEIYHRLAAKADWQVASIHQRQTYDPAILHDKQLSLSDAMKVTSWSSAAIFKVARYWKNKGKKVFLITHSYGSFLAPKMLLDWKFEEHIEKVLILAGRLQMPATVYRSFAQSNFRGFQDTDNDGLFREVTDEQVFTRELFDQRLNGPDDQKPEIPDGLTADQYFNERFNAPKLQATSGQFDYAALMKQHSIPLDRVMWVSGKLDYAVGYFTNDEIAFVQGHATLHKSEDEHRVVTDADVTAYVRFLEGKTQ